MRADMPDVTVPVNRTASIINFILGIWVLISSFLLRVAHSQGALWNNVTVGVTIIAFAANRTWGGRYQSIWGSWLNFISGIWLIISAVGAMRRTSAIEPPVTP
jgi:hypothetical protein